MRRGKKTGFVRVARLALPAAAPALAIITGLALAGRLPPLAALGLGALAIAATAAVLGRLALGITALDETIDEFAADASPPTRPAMLGSGRAVEEIRLAIQHLARHWRAQAEIAQARLVSADALIEWAPDPLILLDHRRQIVRANNAAGELVGSLAPPCDLASALRNPAVLSAADAVLRGAGARTVEFTLAAPVERQLRAQFARIGGGPPHAGEVVAVLSLHDVTELKRAEQMRADFIANASHELRTPLATLTGFIETLRGPARDDDEARDRFLAIMGGQATRMTRLVEDLLSLSRIELNEHVLPRGRVALAPLLEHLGETLELRAGQRGMRIALHLPPDLPDVQGDRDELAQVFQNLLDNAIKYGRAGTEISVGAGVSRRAAGVGAAGAGFVSIAIRDRGEGIGREHLPRLTERFYRVDTARSREMGGTGLGLAIVKHIVSRHRGFLEIDSALGEGSVFTVLLRAHSSGDRVAHTLDEQ